MKLSFFGATRKVTGSCFLLEANGKKILIDCGMNQGSLKDMIMNFEPFQFNPAEIDAMVLTHAHIDHSGRIPKLYLDGFKGPIYCTKATYDLCSIMLPDSGHIQEVEIEWVNRKRQRAGKKPTPALYTAQDATDSLVIFKQIGYDQELIIAEGIQIKLSDAGHMLGSSIVEMQITENGKTEKVVFTGDLGAKNRPLIKDPTYISSADYLVTESTYGDRYHSNVEDQTEKFLSIILSTIDKGGNVVIPSFAVGRTQEILYEINKNKDKLGEDRVNKMFNVPVYVDSPLAVSATEVFRRNTDCFDDEAKEFLMKGDSPLDFKNLKFIKSADESRALNLDPTPKIIISASGMCEVGRIKHHLKHNLWRPESTILFVGYQGEGTLGRRIVDGETPVKIFGEEIDIHARIEYLDSFSGHADKNGLLDWIDNIKEKPSHIFIVHGEYLGQQAFEKTIQERYSIACDIPDRNDEFDITDGVVSSDGKIKVNTEYSTVRLDLLEKLSGLKDEVDSLSNNIKKQIKENTMTDDDMAEIVATIRSLQTSIINAKK